MKRILQKINPAPAKILDIGCSSGHITAKIDTLFPKATVFGLDSYNKAINFGEKLHSEIKFKVGDAHELPFTNQTFDLITCVETLEHLENPAKAAKEMKRVLKKNGKILIGQDTNNWLFRLVWFFWTRARGRVWVGSHIHPYKPQSLENLIKKTGFKVKKKRFSQLGLEAFFLAVKA